MPREGLILSVKKLLPAAVVAKASGLAGVTMIPYDPRKGAGGTCNYAVGGDMVLLVNLEQAATSESFQKYRKHEMYKYNQKDIPGLGDEAFSTGDSIVIARKGKTLIGLSSFMKIDQKTASMGGYYLSKAQLIDLARKALSR